MDRIFQSFQNLSRKRTVGICIIFCMVMQSGLVPALHAGDARGISKVYPYFVQLETQDEGVIPAKKKSLPAEAGPPAETEQSWFGKYKSIGLVFQRASWHLVSMDLMIAKCKNNWLLYILFLVSIQCRAAAGAEIKLSWNAVAGDQIAGYRIYVRPAGQSYDFNRPDWSGADTSCIITNIQENNTYFFVARTVAFSGIESSNSNEVCNYQPVLLNPSNGTDATASTPALQSQALSDPAYAAIHAATQWQISTSALFEAGTMVYDQKFSNQLYSIQVVDFILDFGRVYYWRVRNFDHHQTVSKWSAVFYFSVMNSENPADANGNGIPDAQELKSGVDDLVDLDHNNQPDMAQNDIKVLKCFNGGLVGIIAQAANAGGIDFHGIQVKSLDKTTTGQDLDLPLGLISLEIPVKENGGIANLSLSYANIGQNFITLNWQQLSGGNSLVAYDHAAFAADQNKASLELKDGGYGDEDGLENGKIVHSGGVGAKSAAITVTGAGGSRSGGCFMATAQK